MPDVGLVEVMDAESGRRVIADSSSRRVRDGYAEAWRERTETVEQLLKHHKVDSAVCDTAEDYVTELIKLFKKR